MRESTNDSTLDCGMMSRMRMGRSYVGDARYSLRVMRGTNVEEDDVNALHIDVIIEMICNFVAVIILP